MMFTTYRIIAGIALGFFCGWLGYYPNIWQFWAVAIPYATIVTIYFERKNTNG